MLCCIKRFKKEKKEKKEDNKKEWKLHLDGVQVVGWRQLVITHNNECLIDIRQDKKEDTEDNKEDTETTGDDKEDTQMPKDTEDLAPTRNVNFDDI